MKKALLFGLLLMPVWGRCAGWKVNYEPVNKSNKSEKLKALVPPSDVKTFVEECPKGFYYKDRKIYSDKGSRNKVLGVITLTTDDRTPEGYVPEIPKETISLLQQKASEVGANAVISISLQSEQGYNPLGAQGTAVIMDKR